MAALCLCRPLTGQRPDNPTDLLMRVLYSFPHKLGADRICYTAWQQVRGLASAGADVLLFPGGLSRPVPDSVEVHPTLARGGLRIPYKLMGKLRALALHDKIVARRLEKLGGQVDIVHVWPCAALETIKTAKRLGIPTVLERPNAHTRFCYEVVAAECKRIGILMPHPEYQTNKTNGAVLLREEAEFQLTDYLLCPSEFVVKSFLDRGHSRTKTIRHQYGFDETRYFPASALREPGKKFTALFVGVDDAIVEGISAGATGWIAGLVNAFPEESVALFDLAMASRSKETFELYRWFLPLLRLDTLPKFVQMIKLAEQRAGVGKATVRPPRRELEGAELAELTALIDDAIKHRPSLAGMR